MAKEEKKTMSVLLAHSLRELVETVNNINNSNESRHILKDDIVTIMKEESTYMLFYYQ